MTEKRLFLFLKKVSINKLTECWEWTGATNGTGYPLLWDNSSGKSRLHYAHRLSYEHYVGEITANNQVDHICSVKHCVNPDHLQQVNGADNQSRASIRKENYNSAKTHCKNGHEFTEENIIYSKWCGRNGVQRKCRKCRKEMLTRNKSNATEEKC
jgi:hypothetical protein